jgi:hypothetical protein
MPAFKDLVLFYEYFHGDTGAGLGASHQTGWTAHGHENAPRRPTQTRGDRRDSAAGVPTGAVASLVKTGMGGWERFLSTSAPHNSCVSPQRIIRSRNSPHSSTESSGKSVRSFQTPNAGCLSTGTAGEPTSLAGVTSTRVPSAGLSRCGERRRRHSGLRSVVRQDRGSNFLNHTG